MKKISSLWYGIAVHALAAVIVSNILCSFLIMPAAAAETSENWLLTQLKDTNGPVDKAGGQNVAGGTIYLPEIIPYPPYVTDNPGNRGTYTGPCPIGGNAPQLRQTGLSTGAECRGACGMDCPAERCKPMDDWTIAVDGGTCTYKDVVTCDSHQGCRDHDACYDYCSEKTGETSILFGSCHGVCNSRCYAEYGIFTCGKWAALPGSFASSLGWVQDSFTAPLTDKSLIFSDVPVFTSNTETYCFKNMGECITYDADGNPHTEKYSSSP
jgi:hypothetical protein